MNKIAILGGSGFVGKYIIEELLSKGYIVKAINRSAIKNISHANFNEVVIDLFKDDLCQHLKEVDFVIYNIGIIREFPKQEISYKRLHEDLAFNVIDSSERVGIKKIILMSANGVERKSTGYEVTKLNAEKKLINSKLKWTIFRPSLIFGEPNGAIEFCTQLKQDMISLPLPLPNFFTGLDFINAGSFKMSPIHVQNVSEFFVKSISMTESDYKIYSIGGSRDIKWKDMIKMLSKSCKKKKFVFPVPILLIKLLAIMFDRWPWFPTTNDQIKMLVAGNTCDSKKHFDDFNIEEITFNMENLSYLK